MNFRTIEYFVNCDKVGKTKYYHIKRTEQFAREVIFYVYEESRLSFWSYTYPFLNRY